MRLYDEQVGDNENRHECIEKFQHDTGLINAMNSLAAIGVMDVACGDDGDVLVRRCGTPSCTEIIVVKKRSNNAQLYKNCTKKKQNEMMAEKTREKNWQKQVAHNSTTPWAFLNDQQTKERRNNINREKLK